MASLIFTPQQRLVSRVLLVCAAIFVTKWIFWDSKLTLESFSSRLLHHLRTSSPSSTQPVTPPGEIAHPAILERIALGVPLSGQSLDTRKYDFLQQRVNRDENPDLFDHDIASGMNDFWTRFQKPFALSSETIHLDEQVVRGAVDELLGFNGWAAAACSSLTRPFGLQKKEDDWSDLARPGALYYFALVVHGADHFLIDQLAVIVQLSKRLGPNSIFVSLVDYASTDSTPFICDIAEAVLILLGISFRIRQVAPMTSDPTASYYPLEEAYTRNLALEPLIELWTRRKVKFTRVIWLKGFTCPNDILESLRVSVKNQASMVCGMDWKEHNGFFIYNDRWRTRDMDGNLFRGSKSTSPIDEAPPRDLLGGARYTLHLPFQVFCCESGSHIVDPHKSYYEGVTYQSSVVGVFNTSAAADGKTPRWSEGPCMDSSQLHFCRDMWMVTFREGIRKEAKRLANEERMGKGRNVHPFMEELIQAMQASYAPTTSDKVGYANSGDYLVDETGASPDGTPGVVQVAPAGDGSPLAAAGEGEDDVDVFGDDEEDEEGDLGDEEYDDNPGGDGRPIDPALPVEDYEPEYEDDEAGGAEQERPPPREPVKAKAKAMAPVVPGGIPVPVEPDLTPNRILDDWKPVNPAAAAAPPVVNPEAAGDWKPVQPAAIPGPNKPLAAGANAPAKPPNPDPVVANQPVAPVKPAPPRVPAGAGGVAAAAGGAGAGAAAPVVAAGRKPVPIPDLDDEDDEDDEEDYSDAPGAKAKVRVKRSTLEKRRPRSLPNHEFPYAIAKILVNPRCVTTYAGVSHTQLALDLFGSGEDQEPGMDSGGKYELDEWRTAPESFVCQEMRTTGGRIAAKQQRRTGFQQARLLLQGWRPT